jgi:hypothetical protein
VTPGVESRGSPAFPGRREDDPGVPEAVPRMMRLVGGRLGPDAIDRLWIFPPLRQGRRETGLVAVSCFEPDPAVRRVVTASYTAERTGRGLTLEPVLREEGSAPPETLPRVIAGVVRRTEKDLGEPREVEIGGEEDAFVSLMSEFDPELLSEEGEE